MSFNVEDYSYKPSPVFYGDSNAIHYGVELELDYDYDTDDCNTELPDWVYAKADSTVDGVEFVTHPMTLEEHKKHWSSLLYSLKGDGFERGDNGMHVHISRTAFVDREHLARFCVFFHLFPEFTYKISGRQSRNKMEEWGQAGVVMKDYSRTEGRYYAVNLSNEDTAEVRIFSSTMDPDVIIKRIQLLEELIHFSKDPYYFKTPDELINSFLERASQYLTCNIREAHKKAKADIQNWRTRQQKEYLKDYEVYVRLNGEFIFVEDDKISNGCMQRPSIILNSTDKDYEKLLRHTSSNYVFRRLNKKILGKVKNPLAVFDRYKEKFGVPLYYIRISEDSRVEDGYILSEDLKGLSSAGIIERYLFFEHKNEALKNRIQKSLSNLKSIYVTFN